MCVCFSQYVCACACCHVMSWFWFKRMKQRFYPCFCGARNQNRGFIHMPLKGRKPIQRRFYPRLQWAKPKHILNPCLQEEGRAWNQSSFVFWEPKSKGPGTNGGFNLVSEGLETKNEVVSLSLRGLKPKKRLYPCLWGAWNQKRSCILVSEGPETKTDMVRME